MEVTDLPGHVTWQRLQETLTLMNQACLLSDIDGDVIL